MSKSNEEKIIQEEMARTISNQEIESVESQYRYVDKDNTHLHTLRGMPLLGTSTVVGIIAKPLTWWASGLACSVMGWVNKKDAKEPDRISTAETMLTKIKGMVSADYLALLDTAYKAHSVKLGTSAVAGTETHAICEKYVRAKIAGQQFTIDVFSEGIRPFIEWADANVKEFIFSEAYCFSEAFHVGGISDCGAILNDGSYVIIDFKSSKEAYTSQHIQIAGYALQIEENGIFTKNGQLVRKFDRPFSQYIVFPFGAKKVTAVVRRDVEALKEAFKAAVVLHKIVNVK